MQMYLLHFIEKKILIHNDKLKMHEFYISSLSNLILLSEYWQNGSVSFIPGLTKINKLV